MVTDRPYPGFRGGGLEAPDEYMDAYLLHALNHVAKSADRIKKNTEKLEAVVASAAAARAKTAAEKGGKSGEGGASAASSVGRKSSRKNGSSQQTPDSEMAANLMEALPRDQVG